MSTTADNIVDSCPLMGDPLAEGTLDQQDWFEEALKTEAPTRGPRANTWSDEEEDDPLDETEEEDDGVEADPFDDFDEEDFDDDFDDDFEEELEDEYQIEPVDDGAVDEKDIDPDEEVPFDE